MASREAVATSSGSATLISGRRISCAAIRLTFTAVVRLNPKYFPLYGTELQKRIAEVSGAGFGMTAMGEVLPRYENFVRINPDVKDEWGIPAQHIQQRYTDNEHAMCKDAMNVAEELCHGAGFQVIAKHSQMVPPEVFTSLARAGW